MSESSINESEHRQHVRPIRARGSCRPRADRLVADLLLELFGETPANMLIAVGGPGGTGKSTFARRLAEQLGAARVLKLDDYKTSRSERSRAKLFGPHPDANRIALIAEHLAALRRGEPIAKPIYDRQSGTSDQTELLEPARWIVVDGEVSTYECFRDLVDFSIFIDSHWRTQLATRLGRDLDSRNYTPAKAIATFLHSNLSEFVEHGAASKQWADIHLFCADDYRLTLEAVSREIYTRTQSLLDAAVEPINMEGLIVPVLTPFDAHGQIDARAFLEHLDWLSAAGVLRVMVGGTTGEFFSMTVAERIELLKLALEYFPGMVWMQVGGGPLPEACELAEAGEALGADGLFCLTPGFFARAEAEGLTDYFASVGGSARIPMILYNYSKHIGNPLTPAILSKVRHFGVKDSDGDTRLVAATPRYFSGTNTKILPGAAVGAVGFVSAAANVWPELYVALEQSIVMGTLPESERLQAEIITAVNSLENTGTPALKRRLGQRLAGYPPHVRPPLVKKM